MDSATRSSPRPQTPHDFTLSKSISFENVMDGLPPHPSAQLDASPSATTTAGSPQTPNPQQATPSDHSLMPNSHLPHLSSEIKRDSGIAASFSTPEQPPEPAQPAVGVHHRQTPLSITATTGTPQLGSVTTKTRQDTTGEDVEDVGLSDLASDRVAFSKRGSILYSGKRMNHNPRSGIGQASGAGMPPATRFAADVRESAREADEAQPAAIPLEVTLPNSHTLQPTLQGGRVLSVEEMTFSSRVRSMYEHGNERAASWTGSALNAFSEQDLAQSVATTTKSSTPESTGDFLNVAKTRQAPADAHAAFKSPSLSARASILHDPNELAGGIEDWEDVDGQDVDRYGFINRKRLSSFNAPGDESQNAGIQQVATCLQAQADRPRRFHGLKRNASARTRSPSSLPLALSRVNRDGAMSMHSTSTHKTLANLTSPNVFRSKERKAVAEASDMLTLPPGLAQIAEREDAGKTASALKRKERKREEKWQGMARVNSLDRQCPNKGGGMRFEFDTNDQKLIQRTWKGIPDRWRATAWHSFLSTSAKKRGIGESDEELMIHFHKLQEQGSADDVQIDMDVPRTISMHIMFRRRYRGGQRLLFRVLHAISLYFPDTGYVQGMGSLAATLLCYFEEESAFVMMVRLWQLRGLEQLFESGFEGLMKALEEFENSWLQHGVVAKKLEELNVTSTAYGTRWYLTLFNMSIPFPAQLRVWDVFMLLGDAASKSTDFGGADLDVLHATSAALIDAMRDIILDSDFENVMKVLTSFVPIIDEDLLMRVAGAEWKERKKRAIKT